VNLLVVFQAKGAALQRLFSAFPGRWPGAGLLVLRIAVGLAAVGQGYACITGAGWPAIPAVATGLLAITAGGLLGIGFLTPCAGALVVVGCAVLAQPWLPVLASEDSPEGWAALFVGAVAAALVPLGPGAFSLDARIFGRREIVIPAGPGGRS
jgi:uncharacterized membrane protein YphA (DoxX/SURF4 family)